MFATRFTSVKKVFFRDALDVAQRNHMPEIPIQRRVSI